MDRRNRVKPRMSRVTLAIFLFVLSLQFADATSENDPYTILGVRRTASQAEIKRAYKNLAKEWWVVRWHHPTPSLASRLICTCCFWLDYLFPVKRLFNLLKAKHFFLVPFSFSFFFQGIRIKIRTQTQRTCLSRYRSHTRWLNIRHTHTLSIMCGNDHSQIVILFKMKECILSLHIILLTFRKSHCCINYYERGVIKSLKKVQSQFLIIYFRFCPMRSEDPTLTAMDRWTKNKPPAIHTTTVSMASITASTSTSLFSIFRGNLMFRRTNLFSPIQ